MRRLDALDTRVIGRGNPDWRRPKPWTPGMKPLVPARRLCAAEAWVMGAAGLAVLGLSVASAGDHTISGTVFACVLAVVVGFASYRTRYSHSLVAAAQTVPSDAPVDRSRSTAWVIAAIPGLLVLMVLSLLGFDRDADTLFLWTAMLVAGSLGTVVAERRIAGREDERGVELLRPRQWRRSGFYVRQSIGIPGADTQP